MFTSFQAMSSQEDFSEQETEEQFQSESFGFDDYDVNQVNTGAVDVTSKPANKLKVGEYVMINKRPSRIVNFVKSKIGKHGHAKVSIRGTDIFNGKQYECHLPATHQIDVPIVRRLDYALITIRTKYAQLLDTQGVMRENVVLGDNALCKRLIELYQSNATDEIIVRVISWGHEAKVIDFRKVQ
jgi:translation initiation factor 5A